MSKDTNSSGNLPGEKPGVPRPTVIGATGEDASPPRQPTKIGQPAQAKPNQAAKPTVIGTSVIPPDPKPKVVSSPTAMPKTESPRAPAVVRPTAIPGIERKRIPVTLSELQSLNQATQQPMLEKALRLIQVTNLDQLTDRAVILWGNEPQRKYGELVSRCLTLSQDKRLSKVNEHIARMMEILGLIDLKKVCGLGGVSSSSALSRFIGRVTKAIDTPEELMEAQKELQQLVGLLNKQFDPLLSLKEELEQVSKQIDELGDEIEVQATAATFLADYLRRNQNHPSVGLEAHFTERAMSLTQTMVQVRSSSSMRTVQIEQPLKLISVVQQVALVTVPHWLSSIVSLKTLLDGRQKPTVTEVGELSDQMQNILQQLKG